MTDTEWFKSKLVQRTTGGNWQVQMTVPKEARKAFGRTRHRKSARTSDKRIAESRQHDIEAQMRSEILRTYQATMLWNRGSPYRKAVELLNLEETSYRAEWVDEFSDIEEIPLSSPPKDSEENREAFKVIYEAARRLQANTHSIQAVDLADLEIIRRNGFSRPTENDVEQLLNGLWKTLLNEQPVGGRTIKDVLPEFKDHLTKRGRNGSLKQRTIKERLGFVDQFVGTVGNLHLSDKKLKHAHDFAKALEVKGLANKTINSRFVGISTLMTFAAKEGYIERSPLNGVDLREYGKKSEHYRPLSDEQLSALFDINGLKENVRTLSAILVATGMRTDEAALLHQEQVRLESTPYFDLRVAEVKNDSSKRQVPIPEILLPTVKRLKEVPRGVEGRLLDFAVKGDGKSRASEICSYWRAKVDLYGMAPPGRGKFTNHSMRGSLRDKLRDASVPLEVSNDLMGHDKGKVSGAYGYGTSLRVMKEAVDKIDHPYLKFLT